MKKSKSSSHNTSSIHQPSSGGTQQSSNAQYSQYPSTTTSSSLQQSNNTSYAHSSRFPVNSQQNNNLVLDLISIRPNSQTQNFNNNVCNYSLAISSEGNNNENPEIDPTLIEESILETFQRIDAQNVSNSYELDDDSEQKMSIIENPLSESVIEPSRAEVKTIPFHKTEPTPSRISDTSLYTTPSPIPAPSNILSHPIPQVPVGGEMIVLNNRVDELTK